jgi:hypothetical protein
VLRGGADGIVALHPVCAHDGQEGLLQVGPAKIVDGGGDPFPILVPGVMRESGDGLPAGPKGGAQPRP